MNTLYRITGSTNFFLFLVAFCFFLSAAIFCHQAASLYKKYLYEGASSEYRKPVLNSTEKIRASYISVIKEPTTIACFAFYIVALIINIIRL